jgi:hypothetical protein
LLLKHTERKKREGERSKSFLLFLSYWSNKAEEESFKWVIFLSFLCCDRDRERRRESVSTKQRKRKKRRNLLQFLFVIEDRTREREE